MSTSPSPADDRTLKTWSFLNRHMPGHAEVHDCGRGQFAVYSARAPHKETFNEDAAAMFCYSDGAGLAVVADGMGGMPRGEQASALVIAAIHSSLATTDKGQGLALREGLINGIDSANVKINELGVGAGSTLAAVEIHGREIRTYHIGDSMIMVVGSGGRIKLQTVSHSPVGYAVEAGILDEKEAMHHDERNVVSNLLGFPNMRIEVGPTLTLSPYDTVLVASDGLFDNMYIQEIVEHIRKGPLAAAADCLAATCRERMAHPAAGHPSKPDDLTFVLYRPLPRAKRGRR